ncbi:hypothetical protein U1Q18_043090 [Sarracenia purpurea var. burkii]
MASFQWKIIRERRPKALALPSTGAPPTGPTLVLRHHHRAPSAVVPCAQQHRCSPRRPRRRLETAINGDRIPLLTSAPCLHRRCALAPCILRRASTAVH